MTGGLSDPRCPRCWAAKALTTPRSHTIEEGAKPVHCVCVCVRVCVCVCVCVCVGGVVDCTLSFFFVYVCVGVRGLVDCSLSILFVCVYVCVRFCRADFFFLWYVYPIP